MGDFLSPYSGEFFLSHSGWEALAPLLDGERGGNYALSGPRGSGKTWIMRHAIAWAESAEGLGVWFPSPSAYEAAAFLASLSEVTAVRFEKHYDETVGNPTRLVRRRYMLNVIASGTLIYLGIVLLVLHPASIGLHLNTSSVLAVVPIVLGLIVLFMSQRQLRRSRKGVGRVRAAAEELRMQLRFVTNATEATELGLNVSSGGLGGLLKRARGRQLVERPVTLSALVHQFRQFATDMASEMGHPVVIAIDELDKMAEPKDVAGLLRDIKGIFDIAGVYFLVSISDEAARSVELSGVRARTEFNSSFYAVISPKPLTPGQSVELLRRRQSDFDEETGLALGILTAGLPREIVRLAQGLYGRPRDSGSVAELVIDTVWPELEVFADDVVSATTGNGSADQRLKSSSQLSLTRCIGDYPDPSGIFLAQLWDAWNLNSDDDCWVHVYQEHWRRLIVRSAVGGLIAARPEHLRSTKAASELQRIVEMARGSAVVSRARLARFVVGQMTGRSDGGRELNDREVQAAMLLVARFAGREPVNGIAFGSSDAKENRAGLTALSRHGVIRQRRVGAGARWELTNNARRALAVMSN